jgi:transcriptional regulator with GAF, ATPase, and Fis domain
MTSTTRGAREPALLDAFVALADTLVDDYDVIDLLHHLVETCTQLLAADTAGILLSDGRGQLQVMAYSTEAVRLLELLQLQTNEGPCLDCFHNDEAISAPDLTQTADRWPQFTPRAAREGFRAVHALPMRLRSMTIGALNLFSTQPGPLPPNDLRVGQALADVATIGILHERALRRSEILTEQLQTALNNRITIEQAIGMLAERTGLDFPDVFTRLRVHARRNRVRLSDVARGVLDGSLTLDTLPQHARKTDES